MALVLELLAGADILIEGFRPGVTERMGLGPEACLARNPRLVCGRMTGWGQHGPLAQAAGHDLNCIAISGALHATGPSDHPVPPLNMLGDFGGGMLLAFGVMCAVFEAQCPGRGQVVDAAMTDGAAPLSTMVFNFHAAGPWSNRREDNLLDGGAPFYASYACADGKFVAGKFVAIGSPEPQFYAVLRERCGLVEPPFDHQNDRRRLSAMRQRLAEVFAARTRDEWCELLDGSDACIAPVLDWDETLPHPHNLARQTHVEVHALKQPVPAPCFSRTPAAHPTAPAMPLAAEVLGRWGWSAAGIDDLASSAAVA